MSGSSMNAWEWSMNHSPLLAIWRSCRSLCRPNRSAFVLIEAAGLPEEIDATIRTTIARTKLWRDERVQIARELIAHAQDALDAGRTPEQVVETFGDPRRVARLLRRSMKRKRPVSWKLYRFSRRALGVMCIVLVLGYGWLAARFFLGKPKISVNYAAMLDARNDGYTEDQKSWQVIMEAGYQWRVVCDPLTRSQTAESHEVDPLRYTQGWSSLPDIGTDHPDYAQMVEVLGGFEPMLSQVREAASRPIFGLPVAYETIKGPVGAGESDRSVVPASGDEYLEQSVIGIHLTHLGPTRSMAQVLVFDARVSMRSGEVDRSVEDYIAAMNLARQCRQEPFLISHLVGIAIHEQCMNEIEWAIREFPGVFDADQIARLAHTHARVDQGRTMGLDTEQHMFNDYLQRVYTDDGSGDGYITAEGAAWIEQWMRSYNRDDEGEIPVVIRDASKPIGIVFSNSRAEELRFYQEGMNQIDRVFQNGPQWLPLIRELDTRIEHERVQSGGITTRFSLVGVMMPALGGTSYRYFVHAQQQSAFSLMLAIEAYRIEHGQLPESLDRIAPSFLPEVPTDLMNPGGWVKYAIEGDRYVIYSVGSDGDDDAGTPVTDRSNHRTPLDELAFHLRYPQAYDPVLGEPIYLPDGQPVTGEPQGPDGDWILIDTRPEPELIQEPESEAS